MAYARSFILLSIAALSLGAAPVPVLPGSMSYADMVLLTLNAPTIVHATVVKAEPVAARDAPGLAAGTARVLVTAALTDAIAAPTQVAATIDYLADVAADARGKPPRLKGADVLLFLRATGDSYALSNAHGQLGWTAAGEATVRRILAEARSGTSPVITGIGNAFRVPGGVPGEAESQFFLTTASAKPVSLVVLTRPGEPQRLSLALGDVIDEAAGGVPRDTLLWYRLACFLPPTLPDATDPGLVADYAFVKATLGPCGRTLP